MRAEAGGGGLEAQGAGRDAKERTLMERLLGDFDCVRQEYPDVWPEQHMSP